MKHFLMAILLAGFSSTALAQMYVSGGVHGSFVEEGSETDFIKGAQASFGYRLSPHWLTEVGFGATKANETNAKTKYVRLSVMPTVDISPDTMLFGRVTFLISKSDDWNNFENALLVDPITGTAQAFSEGEYRDDFGVSVGAFHHINEKVFLRFGVGTTITNNADNVWSSIAVGYKI